MKDKNTICCHPSLLIILSALLLLGLYLVLKAPKAASILNLPTSQSNITPTKVPSQYTNAEIDQKLKTLDDSVKELDSSLNTTDINLGL